MGGWTKFLLAGSPWMGIQNIFGVFFSIFDFDFDSFDTHTFAIQSLDRPIVAFCSMTDERIFGLRSMYFYVESFRIDEMNLLAFDKNASMGSDRSLSEVYYDSTHYGRYT